ncbi:MAG: putative endonuclease [Chloroflexota bacterium]|nr:putative endonuclease [Chloroflexota bacterium]
MSENKSLTHNQRLGRWGEQAARDYLSAMGLQIVASNVRTAYGEIDVLARQGDTLVFCEVKTRRTRTYGHPEVAVTPRKQEHMRNAALDYLQSNNLLDTPWRIDVLAIEKGPRDQKESVKVTWFQNALSG